MTKKNYVTLDNRLFYRLLFFGLIITIILCYLAYNGEILEPKVVHVSYAIGMLHSSTPQTQPIFGYDERDYEMNVTFESKGAFIEGREIHVYVDLKPIRNIDEFKKSEIKVVFPEAINTPTPQDSGGKSYVVMPELFLNFDNDSIAHGEKSIVYPTSKSNGNVPVFLNTNGGFSYNLFVNGDPQQISGKIIRYNPILYLAPKEVELQLRNNRLILILTLVIIYFTIVQVLLALKSDMLK